MDAILKTLGSKKGMRISLVLIVLLIGTTCWNLTRKPVRFEQNPGFRADPVGEALADTIAWGRDSYPIPSIHKEFERVCQKIDRGEILFAIDPTPNAHHNTFAFTADENGKPTIVFVQRYLADRYKEFDLDLFRDYIIETILHEAHHAEHHSRSQESTPEIHQKHEDETWWYMVTNVLKPMKDNGRLRNLPNRDVVAYSLTTMEFIKQNRDHKAWKTFTLWVSREQRSEDDLREQLGLRRFAPPPTATLPPKQTFGPQPATGK